MAKLTHEDILAYLEEATILELNDLVKAIEEKFDVTAAAPVAVAAAGADERNRSGERGQNDLQRRGTGHDAAAEREFPKILRIRYENVY